MNQEQVVKDIVRKHLKEIAYDVQTLLQIHMHDYANVFASKHEDMLFQSIKPTLELKNILLEEYVIKAKEEENARV